MVNVGFSRTTDQLINKLKKLKKEKSESGSRWSNKTINYDVERLPASQFTEALNSATAMLETNAESLSSAADLGKFSLLFFYTLT